MPKFILLLTLFLLFSAGLYPTFAQIEDDLDIVEIESSLVVLNATITDAKGVPVAGLNRNQFRIFEDGVEQKVEVFESADTPFAAVILLDTSGSMEQRISLARSAAITFLDGLRTDDNVAIYNFDTKISLVQDFSNSRDITHQIFDLKADGWTAMNDAIYKAAEELAKRSEKRKAIIVLSDGADNRSGVSSAKALKAALAIDATIYTIDMSDLDDKSREKMQNQANLKNLADKTGGLFLATPGGLAMREAFKNIVEELGTQYTLGYEPLNLKKDGKWRKLELRVARSNLNIRTRKGYNAPKEKR